VKIPLAFFISQFPQFPFNSVKLFLDIVVVVFGHGIDEDRVDERQSDDASTA
jgi:hypothetical protein